MSHNQLWRTSTCWSVAASPFQSAAWWAAGSAGSRTGPGGGTRSLPSEGCAPRGGPAWPPGGTLLSVHVLCIHGLDRGWGSLTLCISRLFKPDLVRPFAWERRWRWIGGGGWRGADIDQIDGFAALATRLSRFSPTFRLALVFMFRMRAPPPFCQKDKATERNNCVSI